MESKRTVVASPLRQSGKMNTRDGKGTIKDNRQKGWTSKNSVWEIVNTKRDVGLLDNMGFGFSVG